MWMALPLFIKIQQNPNLPQIHWKRHIFNISQEHGSYDIFISSPFLDTSRNTSYFLELWFNPYKPVGLMMTKTNLHSGKIQMGNVNYFYDKIMIRIRITEMWKENSALGIFKICNKMHNAYSWNFDYYLIYIYLIFNFHYVGFTPNW